MRNSKLKHSKVRNTGLLFEFLLRQITADVLDKKNDSKAAFMIKKRFNESDLILHKEILQSKNG